MNRLALIALASLLAAVTGCDSDDGSNGTVVNQPSPVEVVKTEPGDPPPVLMAVDTLSFTEEGPSGVAPGFNLDGSTATTCNNSDFMSPDGESGIDNQVAILTPLFDVVGAGTVSELVQRSIEEGGLLIMWELNGVDDLTNDPEVDITLRIGTGRPLLGTDGLLLSGQTYYQNPEYEPVTVVNGRIEGGVLKAGPFNALLPIVVFGVLYTLNLTDALMEAELTYDGGAVNGVLGTAIPMSDLWDIMAIAEQETGGIEDIANALLTGIADLDRDGDGECEHMSATMAFTTVSAFLADGPPPPPESEQRSNQPEIP